MVEKLHLGAKQLLCAVQDSVEIRSVREIVEERENLVKRHFVAENLHAMLRDESQCNVEMVVLVGKVGPKHFPQPDVVFKVEFTLENDQQPTVAEEQIQRIDFL